MIKSRKLNFGEFQILDFQIRDFHPGGVSGREKDEQ
jgi:uncharacterized protein YggL (DUF469 family)